MQPSSVLSTRWPSWPPKRTLFTEISSSLPRRPTWVRQPRAALMPTAAPLTSAVVLVEPAVLPSHRPLKPCGAPSTAVQRHGGAKVPLVALTGRHHPGEVAARRRGHRTRRTNPTPLSRTGQHTRSPPTSGHATAAMCLRPTASLHRLVVGGHPAEAVDGLCRATLTETGAGEAVLAPADAVGGVAGSRQVRAWALAGVGAAACRADPAAPIPRPQTTAAAGRTVRTTPAALTARNARAHGGLPLHAVEGHTHAAVAAAGAGAAKTPPAVVSGVDVASLAYGVGSRVGVVASEASTRGSARTGAACPLHDVGELLPHAATRSSGMPAQRSLLRDFQCLSAASSVLDRLARCGTAVALVI